MDNNKNKKSSRGPITSFFNKLIRDEEIKFTDDSIKFLDGKKTEEEQKFNREVQVFNNILQQRNWNGRHLELIGEYRQMDSNFPIISAALKIFSQEACISGDSIVETPMGQKRVDELYATNNNYFLVKSINYDQNMISWAECKGVICKGKQKTYIVVIGKENNTIKCTIDHKIKTPDGFKQLADLKIGDEVGTMEYTKDPACGCLVPNISYTKILDIIGDEEELVYDLLDVSPHSSFLIKSSENNYVNVHNCTRDTDGNVLKIHSDNEKVKNELEDLFINQLKMNSNSYLITKSFLKFGNHFSFLVTRTGEGIIDLMSFMPEQIKITIDNPNVFSLDNFKYTYVGSNLNFLPWEVVHWKFLDDIETIPYGQSILRSIVDTYRRVVMMRDALIIYRITRAPQRLFFKLDTSGLDPDAAELHAKEIKKQLNKSPLVNPKTGEMDYKYSPMSITENIYINSFEGDVSDVRVLEGACLTADTIVRTTNGFMTMLDLSEYFLTNTKKIYSLSVNEHGNEVSNKILWCKKTKNVKTIFKITYKGYQDQFYSVNATDNHPFMLDTLEYRRADELTIGCKLKGIGEDEYTVRDIEIIEYPEGIDVYDLEVEETHNFALLGGAIVHNSNLGDVEDYKIIKDDLFAGLMIPRQYLQFEEVQTAKAALVQEDIRFANLIRQVQGFFIEGLLHIALVHLHAKGYSKEEMESFTIEMNTNSTFAEKTRKELLEQRFSIAQMAWDPSNEGLNFMSYTQVLKEILKFSDSEIEKIIQDQFIEKKLAWRLIKLSQEGGYEETEQDKREEEDKKKAEAGVFKNIQFEAKDFERNESIKNILTRAIDEEIQHLLKPVKAKPTKKQIISLMEFKKGFDFNNSFKERLLRDKDLLKDTE